MGLFDKQNLQGVDAIVNGKPRMQFWANFKKATVNLEAVMTFLVHERKVFKDLAELQNTFGVHVFCIPQADRSYNVCIKGPKGQNVVVGYAKTYWG